MTLNEALKVLDQLAAGYHPDLGEPLPNDSVCNTRSVIRALQMAIDFIKTHENHPPTVVVQKSTSTRKSKTVAIPTEQYEEIDLEEVLNDEKLFEYLYKFKEEGFNPTVARLGKCLVGTQAKSIYHHVKDFPFYGLLEGITTYSEIKPIISNFFEKYEAKIQDEYLNDKPWEKIDFFEQDRFNQLTEFTVKQLTETISALPIKRSLSNITAESMLIARKIYPRAYEPWEQQENSLLLKTLRYTNDLELLSSIFQRGPGAVRSQGQRLLYQIAQSAHAGK